MVRFHFPSNINSASKLELCNYIKKHYEDNLIPKKKDSEEGSQYCLDLDLYTNELTEDEVKKHELYEKEVETCHSNAGNWTVESRASVTKDGNQLNILEDLTQDDIQHLIESEDEISQATG